MQILTLVAIRTESVIKVVLTWFLLEIIKNDSFVLQFTLTMSILTFLAILAMIIVHPIPTKLSFDFLILLTQLRSLFTRQ